MQQTVNQLCAVLQCYLIMGVVIQDDRLIIHFVPYPYTLAYFILVLTGTRIDLSTSPFHTKLKTFLFQQSFPP